MMSAGSAGADELRERLETCLGQRLSDDAWLLREVLRELPRDSAEQLGATLRALEVPPAELAVLARSQLRALELVDPDTSARARDELLAEQTGRERRVALEHCLFPQ
jgi:hypothetical protein